MTGEENNSFTSSLYNKTNVSNDISEDKNVICFLNQELALTKRNEIIHINNKNYDYIISIKITIKNNMNVMENIYYNPKKFFKCLSKIQKSFNNIYLPLCKNNNNETKNNKEKHLNNKGADIYKADINVKKRRTFFSAIICFFKR